MSATPQLAADWAADFCHSIGEGSEMVARLRESLATWKIRTGEMTYQDNLTCNFHQQHSREIANEA